MCNGCLIKMSKIVKLMTKYRIHFPPVFTGPFMKAYTAVLFRNCTVGVQITIRFLCKTNFMDKCIEICFEFWIGECLKGIAGTFNYLENIRVVEWVDCLKFTCIESGCNLKVFHSTGRFTETKCNWNSYRSVLLNPGSPEI